MVGFVSGGRAPSSSAQLRSGSRLVGNLRFFEVDWLGAVILDFFGEDAGSQAGFTCSSWSSWTCFLGRPLFLVVGGALDTSFEASVSA